jgi:hypothetical protein
MDVVNVVKALHSNFCTKNFVVSEIMLIFAVRVGRTRSGRRSVMHQTCGWKHRKFSEQELIIAGGHDGFAHSCVGLYLQFLLSGYPRTSIRNWQKQSPLLLCVEVKIETIIYNKVYEKTTKNGINNSQAPLSLATVAAGSYALYTGGL